MIELLISAFAIGFLGSLHCIGMCGGLISAMTMTRSTTWWPGVTAYQIGRVTTYTGLGLIAGLIGSSLRASWIGETQSAIGIVAGVVIILLALHLGGWLPDPFARLSNKISQATGLTRWINAAATQDSTGPWYVVGLLNGLLPCGLVYAGLGVSLTAPSAWLGAAAMLLFGLGTIPAMMAVPALMRAITPTARGWVLKVGAVILIFIGLFIMTRGPMMGEHGHGGSHMQHSSPSIDLSALSKDAFCFIPGFSDNKTVAKREIHHPSTATDH